MEQLKVGIILGTTRHGRVSPQVGQWVLEQMKDYPEVNATIIDVKEFDLPFYGNIKDVTNVKKWSKAIEEQDAFIFVTAEYNHSMAASMKNAIDLLKDPWANKVAGVVSYGSSNGARAAEHLRGTLTELRVANVRTQVMFSTYEDFIDFKQFSPRNIHGRNLKEMMTQLVAWGNALKQIRPELEV